MRNPHTQDVANVQEALIMQDPETNDKLSLFLNETFYPLNDEVAVFPNAKEAEQTFKEAFGSKFAEETNHG